MWWKTDNLHVVYGRLTKKQTPFKNCSLWHHKIPLVNSDTYTTPQAIYSLSYSPLPICTRMVETYSCSHSCTKDILTFLDTGLHTSCWWHRSDRTASRSTCCLVSLPRLTRRTNTGSRKKRTWCRETDYYHNLTSYRHAQQSSLKSGHSCISVHIKVFAPFDFSCYTYWALAFK